MPSTSFRPRGPEPDLVPRPRAAAVAAAFGALMTAELLFLAVMLVVGNSRLDRSGVVIVVLVLAAAAGTLMTLQGRRGGWLLLALAAIGALAAVGMLALILIALEAPGPLAVPALLAVGPLGCLALAPQRSVRRWAGLHPTRRPAGGRRGPAPSH